MPTFSHPTYIKKKEGTFIVKNTNLNEFVFLSEHAGFGEDTIIYDHRDILSTLRSYGVEGDELSFTQMPGHYASAFMEA